MSRLKDAIQIEYDSTPLSPWGKRIRASATVAAEIVTVEENHRDGIIPHLVEDLKQRILREVYGDLIPGMQSLRHNIFDLQALAGPGSHEPARKALETWKSLMEMMTE
jgi:hypothetical protein